MFNSFTLWVISKISYVDGDDCKTEEENNLEFGHNGQGTPVDKLVYKK